MPSRDDPQRKAEQERLSVKGHKILRQSPGTRTWGQIHDDVDHFAGTWTEKEFREFEKNTAAFEVIDEKQWR